MLRGREFSLTEEASDDFVSFYAPRAAVYEALPGFMLRLAQQGKTVGKRLHIPAAPCERLSGRVCAHGWRPG